MICRGEGSRLGVAQAVVHATTCPVAIWGGNGGVIVRHLGLENLMQTSSSMILQPQQYVCLTLLGTRTAVLVIKGSAG